MLNILYIFILAAVIPFIAWQQREEGRNFISMIITGVFLILLLLTNKLPIFWDNTTILVLCFAIWMTASMFWTNSRQSSQDLFFMLCCLVVFLIARNITLGVLLSIIFMPGVIFAGMSLYNYKSEQPRKKWPIFGNSNHIGAFLLCPLFAGLWLSFNISWWVFPLVFLVVFAMAFNRCRGAQIGTITGLMYVAYIQCPWMILSIPVFLTVFWILYQSRKNDPYFMSGRGNFYQRMSLLVAAIHLIRKTPVAGYGLRTFRREYPTIIPGLLNSRIMKHFYAKDASIESQTSHRIHNDHLEIIFELGFIGYVIFLSLFASLSWAVNPLLAGAVIAFAVHGLFFFPLREAHTAFPFWALAGGMAGTTITMISINPVIAGAIVLIIGRVLYEISVKIIALLYYDQAVKINVLPNPEDDVGKKTLARKQLFINHAIGCDPYNNIYLTQGYYYNVFNNPEIAFQYASRCLENYDGGKVKWGVSDQYARALLRLGGFGVVKMAVRHALHVCPGFQQSIDLMKQINQLESQSYLNQSKVT
ncbi:MAG: O-antigen ligase family protein [Planctomycetota bacterium]